MTQKGEKADSAAPGGSMETGELYGIFSRCNGVSTDSRTLKGGELFFALKGENFDGNVYAMAALDAGAKYAVVDSGSEVASSDDPRLIKVDDTLEALQCLARYHRSRSFVNGKPLPVIALTGTNGKTTTKELIRAVLSVKYNVTATEGNLNNSIGVPLTLLKISADTEVAVVEMGASHPGDISELVSIALPNYGLITNVGKAHLAGFGSFEGVKKAKGELYDYIQRTADKVFLNVDSRDLTDMAAQRPDLSVIPYGLEYQGLYVAAADENHPFMRIASHGNQEFMIETNLVGSYNAANVLAALAVGKEFGVSMEDAVRAVETYVPSNSRSQMMKTERNILIVDAYNANPTSMSAALQNMKTVNVRNKILVLGDMLELGKDSVGEHLDIIRQMDSTGFARAYLVGNEFRKALEQYGSDERIFWFRDSAALYDALENEHLSESVILVKGSRGMRMEKVISAL